MQAHLPSPGWALTAYARLMLCGDAFLTLLGSASSGQATPSTHTHLPHSAQALTSHARPFLCRGTSSPLILFLNVQMLKDYWELSRMLWRPGK